MSLLRLLYLPLFTWLTMHDLHLEVALRGQKVDNFKPRFDFYILAPLVCDSYFFYFLLFLLFLCVNANSAFAFYKKSCPCISKSIYSIDLCASTSSHHGLWNQQTATQVASPYAFQHPTCPQVPKLFDENQGNVYYGFALLCFGLIFCSYVSCKRRTLFLNVDDK